MEIQQDMPWVSVHPCDKEVSRHPYKGQWCNDVDKLPAYNEGSFRKRRGGLE